MSLLRDQLDEWSTELTHVCRRDHYLSVVMERGMEESDFVLWSYRMDDMIDAQRCRLCLIDAKTKG